MVKMNDTKRCQFSGFIKVITISALLLIAFVGCISKEEREDKRVTHTVETDQELNKKTTKTDSSRRNNEDSQTAELKLPIVDDGSVRLTLFTTTRIGVDDFENNAFTKWVEEQTGLNLDFVVAPEQSGDEKLNVLLASGEYPDILTGNRMFSLTQLKLYGEQGIFIPLNDLIEEHGVNIKKVMDESPQTKKLMVAPDGNIYGLPNVNEVFHSSMSNKMWVYQPWLETLGLDAPQTTEEFKDMLIAFRDKDPNGNGKADEIPMMGAYSGGWNSLPDTFLLNSFTYYDNNYGSGLYINNGKVAASYTEEAWKEGVKYINGLVREGLLAPETYTQDNNILIQNADNPTPIVGAIPSGYMGMFTQIGASDRWKDFVAIAPLEGPSGVRYAKQDPYIGTAIKFVITNKCKHPVEAFKLGDFFYTEEASFRNLHGEPGVGWDYLDKDSGKKTLEGTPAYYEAYLSVDDVPKNTSWNQSTIVYRPAKEVARAAVSEDSFEGPLYVMTLENYEPYKPSLDMIIPPMYFTDEQINDLLTVETAINAYVTEKKAAFITGALDIDSNWDKFLAELETMGLQRMIDIYQEAISRN